MLAIGQITVDRAENGKGNRMGDRVEDTRQGRGQRTGQRTADRAEDGRQGREWGTGHRIGDRTRVSTAYRMGEERV